MRASREHLAFNAARRVTGKKETTPSFRKRILEKEKTKNYKETMKILGSGVTFFLGGAANRAALAGHAATRHDGKSDCVGKESDGHAQKVFGFRVEARGPALRMGCLSLCWSPKSR